MDKGMGVTGVKRGSQWDNSCSGRVADVWITQAINATAELFPWKKVLPETAQYIRRLILNSNSHFLLRNRH